MCNFFGLFGGGDDVEQVTSNTVTEIPDWVQGPAQNAFDIATNIAEQEYTPYSGPRVAGLTDNQNTANDMAASGAGQHTGAMTDAIAQTQAMGERSFGAYKAGDAFGGFDGEFNFSEAGYGSEYSADRVGDATKWNTQNANEYFNPFVNTQLKYQNDELMRRSNQMRSKIAGNAALSGGYGGSRHGIVESEHDRNTFDTVARNTSDTLAKAYDTAYGQYAGDEDRRIGVETTNQGAMAQQFKLNTDQYNSENARRLAAEESRSKFSLDAFNASADQHNADNAYSLDAYNTNVDQFNEETQFGLDSAAQVGTLGVTQGNLDQQDLNNLLTTGQNQQGVDQANLDVAYSDFVDERDWDTRGLDAYLRALSGTPYPTSTTQTGEVLTQNPSVGGQVAGAALSAYGSGLIG